MNILVLGGNGYLGSKVIRALMEENQHTITCTVRSMSSQDRIISCIEKGLVVIPASLDAVRKAMNCVSFDTVFNMVCSYGKINTLYNNVIEANIEYPLYVMDCLVEMGCKRFLTIGTGLPDDLNMYSFSKKMFSEFGNFYVRHHGVDFLNMKLQMFYGDDEPRERFIPQMIQKMLLGQNVDVTLGTQRRDIVAVSDVIRAIMVVFHSKLHGYQEISVGTGIAPRISELVDYIWTETGMRSCVRKGAIPMRENEPDCIADTTKLNELMDWEPIYWKQGIRQMICNMKGLEL